MKPLLTAVFAILIGYGSEIAPYYVKLFAETPMTVLGRLDRFDIGCTIKSLDEKAACLHRYRIDQKYFEASKGRSIGAGIILSSTRFYCEGNPSNVLFEYGDILNPKVVYDTLNVYQAVNLDLDGCKTALIVEAWSPVGVTRHGHIGVSAVIGDRIAVERIQRLVSFFNSDIRTILVFMVCFIFLFSRSLRLLNKDNKVFNSAYENNLIYWVGFLMVSSGLLQTIFPLYVSKTFFSRISGFFSLSCHIGVLVALVRGANPGVRYIGILNEPIFFFRNQTIKPPALYLFTALIAASPVFFNVFGPLAVIVSTAGMIFSLASRNIELAAYSGIMFINSLKVLNFNFLPHTHVTSVFVVLRLLQIYQTRFKESLDFLDLANWSRLLIEKLADKSSVDIAWVLREFIDKTGVGRATMLILNPGGGCSITIAERKGDNSVSVEKITRDFVPPVFAHAITTREELWHVNANSIFAQDIRKGERSESVFSSEIYSIIPLTNELRPIGALSITHYSRDFVDNHFKSLQLKSTLQLVKPIFGQLGLQSAVFSKEEFTGLCDRAVSEIRSQVETLYLENPSLQLGETLTWVISELVEYLKAGIFLSAFDPMTRKLNILAISGYDGHVKEQYLAKQFYAFQHNEQGPLALAVNRMKPIIVSDVRWLKAVLYPSSREIFDVNKTKSCAAVPILMSQADVENKNTAVWGVLWLERNEDPAFTAVDEIGLRQISQMIGELILKSTTLSQIRGTRRALSGFLPEHVMNLLLENQPTREDEEGFLLMIDMKGSTKISHTFGAKAWEKLMASSFPAVRDIASKYGFTLQLTIWDAFFLTRKSPRSAHAIKDAVQMVVDVHAFMKTRLDETFPDAFGSESSSSCRARACLVFGDTSRDVVTGMTQSWTIVGTSMAEVHKLESACKNEDGWFFSTENALEKSILSVWKNLAKRVPGTESLIFSLGTELNAIPVVSNIKERKAA